MTDAPRKRRHAVNAASAALCCACAWLFVLLGCEADIRLGDLPEDAASLRDDRGSLDAFTPALDATLREDLGVGDGGLGDGALDAGSVLPPVEPGRYDVMYNHNSVVRCDGDLFGQEAAFFSLMPADVGFEVGEIMIQPDRGMLILSGDPIETAFSSPSIVLRENAIPEQPPGTYFAVTNRPGGPGPANSFEVSAAINIDSTTQNPPFVFGDVGVGFLSAGSAGECFVSFPTTYRRS